MALVVVRRCLRRAGLLAAVVSCVGAIGAASASALNVGTLLRGPVSGAHVDLGCANPANHGLAGQVLGAANVSIGGPVRCFSQAIAHARGEGPKIMSGPTGLGPKQIQSAYKLAGSAPAGGRSRSSTRSTIPRPRRTSATYRSHYGLPACTTANGCFKKVNQNGAASAAARRPTTAGRRRSASTSTRSRPPAPTATSCSSRRTRRHDADLDDGRGHAPPELGAVAISNSYGGAEDSTILTATTRHFNHPGIAITASSRRQRATG